MPDPVLMLLALVGVVSWFVAVRDVRADLRRRNRAPRTEAARPVDPPSGPPVQQHAMEWASQHISVADLLRRESAARPHWPPAKPVPATHELTVVVRGRD